MTEWMVTRFHAVSPAAASEVRSILERALGSATAESAVTYVVGVDRSDPAATWVVEEWASESDAQQHEKAAAHPIPEGERLAHLLADPFDPVRIRGVAATPSSTTKGTK